MKFVDDGEVDDKIVVVPADNRDDGNAIDSLDDVSHWVKKAEHHFTHYKDLKKPGSTKVTAWGDAEEAKKVIAECIERFKSKGLS